MRFFHWLDQVPLGMLAIIALLLALAPFSPEPHLWEKLKMLVAGTLTLSLIHISEPTRQ